MARGVRAQAEPDLPEDGPVRMKNTWYGPYFVIEWGGAPDMGVKKERGDVFEVSPAEARRLLADDKAVVLA